MNNVERLSYRYSSLFFGVVGIQVLLQLQRTELHLFKETIGHDLESNKKGRGEKS